MLPQCAGHTRVQGFVRWFSEARTAIEALFSQSNSVLYYSQKLLRRTDGERIFTEIALKSNSSCLAIDLVETLVMFSFNS